LSGRCVSRVHPAAVVGSCCSFLARYRCPVIFASDARTCGKMIVGILRRLEEERAKEAAA